MRRRKKKSPQIKQQLQTVFQKKSSLSFTRKRKKLDVRRYSGIGLFVVQILLVVALAFFVVNSFFIKQTIQGNSMEPSLADGNHVLTDQLTYKLLSPKRNHVVGFSPTNNPNSNYSFKRIIGLPGDTVQIREGHLYINDEAYEDVMTFDLMDDAGVAANPIVLSEDEYFLLGDNRNDSEDSRYASIGTVKKNQIHGRLWFCYSPDHFGPVID